MAKGARKCTRYLAGALCASALLAGTVGVASAEVRPQAFTAAAESSSAVSSVPCISPQNPPGCIPE